jgi:D-serine deaminase-like pyridoxal phosphate-dependent protein
MTNNNWYLLSEPGLLDTPALVVFPERVRANIRTAIDMVAGDPGRLRPHVKTNKSAEVTRRMLDAGRSVRNCCGWWN